MIFLDEPTSGLDSEIAFEVMDAVRAITDQNRTVLVTIHQPSPETFALFDTVLLLAQGKVVYFGDVVNVKDCFSMPPLDYHYIKGQNIADYVVRVCGGKMVPQSASKPRTSEQLSAEYHGSPHYSALDAQLHTTKVPPSSFETGPRCAR